MDIIDYKERCVFCFKNKATRLCDIVIGRWAGHPPKGETRSELTCDAKMCKECSLVFRDMDICPKCQKELKEKLKGIE